MYVRFKILTIKPILGEKAICIESTHEIDSQTILPRNIRVTRPGDPIEELLWKDFKVEGKFITLYFEDEPLINERYLVRIHDLKNIIDDGLETIYSQSIIFESFTRSEIKFLKPVMHSIIDTLNIELDEVLFETQRMGANYFEYELSSDPLFLSNELLIDKQESSEKEITFDLQDYKGQLFVRCRAFYIEQTATHHGDWIHTTCVINKNTNALENNSENTDDPMIELALEVIDAPTSNAVENCLTYVFDTKEITSVDNVTVTAKPLNGDIAELLFTTYEIINNNTLQIVLDPPLPKNCLVSVQIKNVKAGVRVLKEYKHTFYSTLDACYGDLKDIESLLDLGFALDPQVVYYHLIEASKLADYYADIKLNSKQKNAAYYLQVEYAKTFEKAMFVKYYAANQILSQIRSRVAYNASLSGKLGEIEYTPKGALPDLANILKDLDLEAQKWKLALQGYKDHPADAASAIKAKKCLPHNHIRGWR